MVISFQICSHTFETNQPSFFILGTLLAVQTFKKHFLTHGNDNRPHQKQATQSRNRYSGKVVTAKYLLELLGEKPNNKFIEWLSPQIRFTDANEFHTFMETQGRCRTTPNQAQLINDFWKEHWIISGDRRNEKNCERIKLHPLVRDTEKV